MISKANKNKIVSVKFKTMDLMLPLLALSDRQDLYSMAYVRAIIAASGFGYSRTELDRYSDDLSIECPYIDSPDPKYSRLVIQVKCSYYLSINNDGTIHFPLSIKNYDDLRKGIDPRILVVVLVPRPDGNPIIPWIEYNNMDTIFRHRAYWVSLWGKEDVPNTESVTVYVPADHTFDVNAVYYLMKNMVIRGNKAL